MTSSSSSMPGMTMGATSSDSDIAAIVTNANQGEVDQGNLASTKANSDDVRAFARMMVTDHTNALNQASIGVAGLVFSPFAFSSCRMRALIPVWPEFVRTDDVNCDDALAVVGFGDAPAGACVTIAARQLGSVPLAEVWRTSLPIEKSRSGDVSFAANGAVLVGTISATAGETDVAAARVYEQIVDAVRTAGYPNLLRVWNHVGSINECEGDLERYKRFSKGRHEALTRCGYQRQQFPAASAVGTTKKGLAVYFVASRTAGVQVENPRQVAAYDYPPVHGPRSPSFARATVAQWNGDVMIFVSGTSSVVGHETKHHGNVEGQLDETLENMRMIVAEAAASIGRKASLDDLTVAKTYLRNAGDYERIAPLVMSRLPSTQHLFVESDICRRDLLLEIEGVARI